jgi:membrane fusion protein, macrolide-specific efflux system
MARWNKVALAIVAVALCAVGIFLWLARPAKKHMPVAAPAVVDSQKLPLVLQGRSYCSVTLPVPASMSGEVTEIGVSIGQAVKKDDLLFKLKLPVGEAAALSARLNKGAALQAMEMDIQKLKIMQDQLTRNIVEMKQLDALGMAPRNGLADMQDQLRLNQNQLELAKLGLTNAKRAAEDDVAVLTKSLGQPIHIGSRPQYVIIRAPQDGNVISIDPAVRLGGLVSGVLCTIGVMDPMIIRGQVHESELDRLQGAENATITLDAGKGEAFEAKLSRVSWAALDNSLTAPAYYLFELVVPNPEDKIKDGFKVQVTLQPPQKGN